MPRATRRKAPSLIEKTRQGLAAMKRMPFYGRIGPPADALDVAVCPGSIRRALTVMRRVIKAIEADGGDVVVENDRTLAVLDGTKVEFRLREQVRQEEAKGGRLVYDHHPTGVFQLAIREYVHRHCKKRWVDKTDRPVENQIDSFVEGLRVAARLVAERAAEQAAQELTWAEQEAQRRAEEEAHRAEQVRREQLFDEVEAWQRATRLRRYVAARVAAGDVDDGWVDWASAVADEVDPVVRERVQ